MATKKILGKTTGATKKTATARKLKAAISQAKDASDPGQRLIVHGTVSYRDTSPAIGLTVTAFDKDIGGEDRLGQATTDAIGGYRITYSEAEFRRSPNESRGADIFVRIHGAKDVLLFQSKTMPNAPADLLLDVKLAGETFVVRGQIRLADGTPVAGALVRAYDKDLRSEEEPQGEPTSTDKEGRYEIRYSADQFRRDKKLSADLVVKAFAADGSPLATSETLYNAPPVAEVDLTISAEVLQPPTLFEKIGRELAPLLEGLSVEELEEDKQHQNLSFLSGKTGFEKNLLARFVMAHKLAQHCMQAEFWFALLGGSFFQFVENQSLKEQVAALLDSLSSLDAAAARKALIRAFNQKEIPEAFRENVDGWVEAFLKFIASHAVRGGDKPTFVKLALEHASIEGAEKQENFARLFNEHKALTPELLATLEKDKSFNKTEIADLRTSFQLTELTRGDFSVVKMLKEEFDVRQPEKIRTLAKKSASEWVSLVKEKHAAGEIKLPIEVGEIAGQIPFPAAEVYGKTLERQFREAFPTTAFSGGLERAIQNGGARGLPHAEALGRFLDGHEKFEFLNTPVDDFLKNNINPDFRALAEDEDFRLEVKAVQRVFKLAPTFEATEAMLADGVHSAQMAYRMGESEFVRSYAHRPGFTEESARIAYHRAADTYAGVLTLYGDLISLNVEGLPESLKNGNEVLSTFPNWNNLFKTGDFCECEHCRSVLGPAAYFADLLMFLKDRKSKKLRSVKDILFDRRPDLGYLSLNCDNALTRLPYIDVVCEVLEDVVAAGENDRELIGLTTMPAALPNATLTRLKTFLILSSSRDAEISLSQVDPMDLNRWVLHGNNVTYLLKKKATPNFFAEILRNTEASAAELRAYPQYVNPKAYEKLRAAKYPLTLPFDLFAEEVRATFQKTNLQRWDLMRTLRGMAAPNNPTDGEIAAEYFGISVSANSADPSEKLLILKADPSDTGQQAVWGETNSNWLAKVGNVKNFLQKTGLEYNELLVLLDLKFINPKGDIQVYSDNISCYIDALEAIKKALLQRNLSLDGIEAIRNRLDSGDSSAYLQIKNFYKHAFDTNDFPCDIEYDTSCDTDKKVIRALDAAKLDRIHRFLRLWRKLKDWKMWELDLVIRSPGIGRQNAAKEWLLNEPFLVNLYYFSQLRNRLGGKTNVEQVCALFSNLNTETHFTKLHEKREDALYQNLFLNKRLIQPLDLAFEVAKVEVLPPLPVPVPMPQITPHHPVVLAALGVQEADLILLKGLIKPSLPVTHYINDDLTLTNLSFLWRHAWLSKLLKFNAEEWKILLKVFHQDIMQFANPMAAFEFVEKIDQLKAAGFTPDELNWLLAADRTSKAATKEADAARFLAALRKELQAIQTEYSQAKYDVLIPVTPTDVNGLTTLLTSLLQKLNWDEFAVNIFLKTLRGSVLLEASVPGGVPGFTFPTVITAAIPILYDKPNNLFRFTGLMTDAQRETLLNDVEPALVTLRGSALLEASVQPPLNFVFPAVITAAIPILYNKPKNLFNFTGLMTDAQRKTLLNENDVSLAAVVGNLAYKSAIEKLYQESLKVLSNYRSAIDELYQQSLTAVTDYFSMEKDVALPAIFAFPATITGAPNAIPIRCEQVLRFTGVMTADQHTKLLAVTKILAYQAAIESLFKHSGTAIVTDLPANFKFHPAITTTIPIRLEQVLRFTGVMTADQRKTLLQDPLLITVTGIAAYQEAIEEFFDRPRLAVKFFVPLFTAALAKLPAAVEFKTQLPDELAAKIDYDTEQRLLRFTGFMSNKEKTKILLLSGDADYVAAVNSLAAQPQTIASTDSRIWLTGDDLDIAQPDNDTYSKRLANAARKALKYLSATLAENTVVQQTSTQLGLTEALTRRLLTAPSYAVVPILSTSTPPVPTKTTLMTHLTSTFIIDSTTFNSWFWANRVAVILKKWKITLSELDKIITLAVGAKLLDLSTLPLDATGTIASLENFLRTSRLLKMRESLPETDITLLDLLEKLNSGVYAVAVTASNPTATTAKRLVIEKGLFAADVERLNEAWLAADVVDLVASLNLAYPTDYLLAESWERLRRAFYFLDHLNASANTVRKFAAAAMTDVEAKTLKELLRSKFGTETWLALSTEIQDVLRERKRDALVAYLLIKPPAETPSRKWENTNDLYAYYLLDVEMSSCQLTSRLVQASGSVQLFVQRCFMGLEPDVVVQGDGANGSSAWRWWKWMRKYQVWVANRKVFLWPENFIEPELKKDRSPFFKDMENELLQNEVNQYTVETAFSNYLEKLDGVAQLEIAGFFQEDDGHNTIVHVFGRTAGAEPHLYYYRRYDYRQWTPWEKVELDIQGDYLIPAVVNKRLYLFWPVFTEVPDELGNSRVNVPTPGQKIFTPDKTKKKLRLQMAVSDYRLGKWTPKKVSKDFHESEPYNVEIVRQHYQFFFIDNSNVDGRFGIQYEGHSVGDAIAAAKAKQDLDEAVTAANKEKTNANDLLAKAKAALVALKTPVDLAKRLLLDADFFFGVNHRAFGTASTLQNLSLAAQIVNGDAHSLASDAKRAIIVAAGLSADAVLDAQTFIDALVKLIQSFEKITVSAAANNSAPNLSPLIIDAQKAANTAVDAGVEALRTATAFRDDAASDAKSAGKEYDKVKGAQVDANATNYFKPGETKRAILKGAFEISGSTGVPEKADPFGSFTPAIRPEQASVGDDPAFLKWVEITSRRDVPPQDDFTLANRFWSRPPISDTLVLGQTPDIFKMSAAWHLSYMDKIGLDSNPSYNKTGTWLPFFYNDKKRTFFVLPSSQFNYATGPDVRGYYPKIKQYLDETFTSDMEIISAAGVGGDLRQYLDSLVALSEDRLQFQKFHFKNFYHPFVCDFAKLVYNPLKGIPALMSRETQLKDSEFLFLNDYAPQVAVVKLPSQYPLIPDCYPREVVDFTPDGAYSPYNWELFFHAPLMIANSLSKNQRFEEAREWYHFIFNPIGVENGKPGATPMSKYWITKPFFETTDSQYVQQRIENILLMLAKNKSTPGPHLTELEKQVDDWRTNPFEPHRIANYRTVAYQKTVVMKYLDNLIAWGDNLFRQESMESINEATQLYIMAAEILGPRPKMIPPRTKPPVASFNELETEFDKFSNALVQVENLVPLLPGNSTGGADQAPLPMLYFCIPRNDKMLGYWDTVADRLYKIRHCMNIEGVVRQLALFEPPIDPAALVKAVAGGVDISSALADLNAPLPIYRFNILLQKANEVCNDVKALGGALLAALEKKDAEAMGLLRQGQELRLLEAVKAVREKQIEEAKENLEGMRRSKELAGIKKKYYENKEFMNALEIVSATLAGGSIGVSGLLASNEVLASVFFLLPSFNLGVSGVGGSPQVTAQWGSENIAKSIQSANSALQHGGSILSQSSSLVGSIANYQRRQEDWNFQSDLAIKEIDQIDRQIASAELRIAIAKKELENHAIQIENAKATDSFMRSKYTNQELYQWQVGQISGVYFQSYKLAYDLAKRAERCFRFELGLPGSSYINFGYWDSLKKGLLSGEKLQYDLRRLDTAYLEQNRREFELTKHVSLTLLDPLALVKLRETGRCFFHLPEEIFDLDYPGHYFRRIKSVSLTLPCVVGPYTTISCTLRLLKNSIRVNTNMVDGYPRNTVDDLPADDDRFIESNIPVKAIAASSAQNDSGVFELSFRDERYLPFEGAGAVSEWSLELFSDNTPDFGKSLRQFDYKTISDAILHVKYTAREDAGPFKNSAVAHLRDYLIQDGATPSLRMFNLRQEFPTQWHRFLNPTDLLDENVFELEMSLNLFPIRDQGKTLKVNTISLLGRCTNAGVYSVEYSFVILNPSLPALPPPDSDTMRLTPLNQYGGLHFSQKDVAGLPNPIRIVPTDPPVKWKLRMTPPSGGNLQDPVTKVMEVEDLLLVLGYEWE